MEDFVLKIAWVMGWAVPESWFAAIANGALPHARNSFFPSAPGTLQALAASGPFDWVCGYSLGTLLLLAAPPEGIAKRVALFAPIFAFASEAGLGGRVPGAEVKHLARLVRRDVSGALAGFYKRAGLDVPEDSPPPSDTPALLWGLERLANDRAEPPLPKGWRAWCGAADPLLDSTRLLELDPAIRRVPGATHHPAHLLAEFARDVA